MDATLAGRVDGTVTRLFRSGSYEVTARPASTAGCGTGRQTTDQQQRHPNRGVSHKQESGRLTATDTLTVIGITEGAAGVGVGAELESQVGGDAVLVFAGDVSERASRVWRRRQLSGGRPSGSGNLVVSVGALGVPESTGVPVRGQVGAARHAGASDSPLVGPRHVVDAVVPTAPRHCDASCSCRRSPHERTGCSGPELRGKHGGPDGQRTLTSRIREDAGNARARLGCAR